MKGPWRRHNVAFLRGLGLAPILLLLLAFFAWPVLRLLSLSVLTPDGAITSQHYARLASSTVYFQVLFITFKIAAWTTLCSLLLAYPVAYWIAGSHQKVRDRLVVIVLLTFWSSALVKTFAWLVILGRNGVIVDTLRVFGIATDELQLLFNLPAVILGMTNTMTPLAILTMLSVMEGVDRRLVPAAGTLGARPGSTFWLIYFPQSFPGVTASAVLVFISSIGFFITPAFLGGRGETMIGQIIIEQVIQLLNWPFAGVVSVLLLAATLAGLVIFGRNSSLFGPSGVSSSAGGRASRGALSLLRLLARASDALWSAYRLVPGLNRVPLLVVVCIIVLFFLLAPALVMVPLSFNPGSVVEWPPKGFTLRWYVAFWESPIWFAAAARSFSVAFVTGVLCIAIATPFALLVARHTIAGRRVLMGLILAPLIVPRVIIAVALFYFFAQLGLIGTSLGLVIGHVVLAVPYVVVTLNAAFKDYDWRLDDAASIMGARPTQTLWRIALPILRTSFLSAFLFAFVTSLDELTVALFVTGGLMNTLPKQIWDEAFLQITPVLASVSTLMLVVTSVLVIAAEWLRRAGVQSKKPEGLRA